MYLSEETVLPLTCQNEEALDTDFLLKRGDLSPVTVYQNQETLDCEYLLKGGDSSHLTVCQNEEPLDCDYM